MVEGTSCIVIPARLPSARLPGKLLMEIDGMTVIERTYHQCVKTGLPIYVLTDSERVVAIFEPLCPVFLTTIDCKNGTERISRHLHHIPEQFTTIINVQGDEPYVSHVNVMNAVDRHMAEGAHDPTVFYTTLHEEETNAGVVMSQASVKVVTDNDNNALWYSRLPIPVKKGSKGTLGEMFKLFTGIYVFNRALLAKYSEMEDTPSQIMEDVEQLKVLEHGYKIKTYKAPEYNEISVNTQEDLEYLRRKYLSNEEDANAPGRWLLDCTLRDGGYINNWLWEERLVHSILQLISPLVRVMEVGFCNMPGSYKNQVVGSLRCLTRKKLTTIRANMDPLCQLAVMVDLAQIDWSALEPRNEDIDMVRVAFHKEKVVQGLECGKRLKALGYTVCLNFMISNRYTPEEMDGWIAKADYLEDGTDYVYIADSLGCMTQETLQPYVDVIEKRNKLVGLHLHNNAQRALSNQDAFESAGRLMDGTVYGMGRGAGNVPLEVLIPTEKLLPVLLFIEKEIKPLYGIVQAGWGYDTDFLYAARVQCHPNFVGKMRDLGFSSERRLRYLNELAGEMLFDATKVYDLHKKFDDV